ncbi:MAG: hypothetical protein U0232_19630 [Thermomicrobiales bacterium]
MSSDDPLDRLVAEQTRPGASDEERAVHRLILAVAIDPARQLTEEELARIVRQIAGAGFDPNALERARGNIVKQPRLGGGIVQTGDRLPPAEAHYLRHCLAQREWPTGTTLLAYLASIREVVLDSRSGILVNRYQDAWQLAFIRESRALRGPGGHQWLLVDYRVHLGHWTTAHQLEHGLSSLGPPRREQIRWLRPPQLS